MGLAGFAVTATFARAISPAIGGYLNDTYGWPWVFYVNLAPGAVMFAALWHGLPKADARLLVGAGLLVFGASCFMNLDLDLDYAAPQLFWPDVTRALGQAIILTPLSAIAMVGIAPAGQHIRFARLRIPPDPRTTALEKFDAYPLFRALGDTIETGPTGNNLRDLRILLAY